MTTFDTSLLPPRDEPEPQPQYRNVWRSVILETGLLIGLAVVIMLGSGFVGVELDAVERRWVTTGLALVPVGLWLVFSWRVEQQVRQPRKGLLGLLVISLLVANAAVAPFIEVFIEPDLWLNALSGLTRIFGFAITVGVATEFGKYLVLRYTVWPDRFERRIDAVAYGRIVSLGFATVFNLRFALLDGGGQPGAAMIHIMAVTLAQQGIGLIMAYRLMDQVLGKATLYGLALNLLLGGFLHGVFIAVRAGFAVQSYGVGAVSNSPLLSFGFSVAFGVALYVVYAFLISTADARDLRSAGQE